jgi:hypothetical protein
MTQNDVTQALAQQTAAEMAETEAHLQVLAKQRDPAALYALANILLIKAVTDAERAEALALLRQSEQLDYPPAAYRLAVISLTDTAEALDWQKLAERMAYCCRQEHANALCDAAVFYGRFGTALQRLASTDMLETAAMRGSVLAMALLGERLASGTHCKPDPARANSIRRLALNMGLPVPEPDPRYGFSSPEPGTAPVLECHFDFSGLQAAAAAPAGHLIEAQNRLRRAEAVFSAEECLYIQCLGGPDLEPSVTVDEHGTLQQNRERTSHDFIFLPESEQIYLNILQCRMAGFAGIPLAHAEALILLRYHPGQEYKTHRDNLPASHFIPVKAGGSGQRQRTVIAYLNTPAAGGETQFPLLGLALPAVQGQLICFDNLLADGKLCRTSLHAGLPVIQGVKWICTLWMREHSHRLL